VQFVDHTVERCGSHLVCAVLIHLTTGNLMAYLFADLLGEIEAQAHLLQQKHRHGFDPAEFPDDGQALIGTYAGWLLGILLALRQRPDWIYGAVQVIRARALERQRQGRYDGGVDRSLEWSQRA
jgi:hypothetical protein